MSTTRNNKAVIMDILISLILFSSLIPISEAEIPDYIIDGDRVYIDDAKVAISASPHTLPRSDYVYINVTSKVFTGDVDFSFGFEANRAEPRSLEIYMPHNETREEDLSRFKDGEHKFNTSENIVYIYYNQTIYETSENETGVPIGWEWVQVYSHYYDEINVAEGWIKWYEFKLWKNLASKLDFITINRQYSGMDEWKCAIGNPVTAGVEYRLRVFLEIFPTLNKEPSKYCIAFKPSSETLQDSIDLGHLYLLDPWLTGGWDQRVKITVDSSDVDGTLTNFPILLKLGTSVGRNSDDVSFVFDELGANSKKIAVTTSDGETECYVEIEKWLSVSEEAWLWVKVPSISNTVDTDLYLYFDNDHADNTAYIGDVGSTPGEAVWDANFLVVYHFSDAAGGTVDSTSNDNDGSAIGTAGRTASGQIDGSLDIAGSDDGINIDSAGLGGGIDDLTVEGWINLDALVTDRAIASNWYGGGGNRAFYLFYDQDPGTQWRFLVDDNVATPGLIFGTSPPIVDTWYYLAGVRIRDDDVYAGQNGALVASGMGTSDTPLETTSVDITVGTNNLVTDTDGQIDEIRISDTDRSSSWIKATYESGRDDLLDWETESEVPTITSATIIGLRDGDNIYVMYEYTPYVAVVDDLDGATDIDKVYLQIKNGAEVIGEFRATSLTGTPAWAIQTGSSVFDLDTGSCTWGESGNEGTATFKIRAEWDVTQYDDLELAVYVEDSVGGSEGFTDMQTNYFDIVSRLVTYDFAANKTSVKTNSSIELSGHVRYATTTTGNLASSTWPPDGQFTNVTIKNDQEEIEASDTEIIDGFFNVTFNAHTLERTTYYYVWLDLLDDYVDGLAPDGDYVAVTTSDEFYISGLIDAAFNFFNIAGYIAQITTYGSSLGAYFTDSVTNVLLLITQQFRIVLSVFGFVIDWYTRMVSLLIQIGDIITGLIDGTGDVTSGLGNLWDYISINTWIDVIPVFLFIWWVESIASRGRVQGEISVFLGDIQTVMNITSWFMSMFSLIINTMTDLAFRLMSVIT